MSSIIKNLIEDIEKNGIFDSNTIIIGNTKVSNFDFKNNKIVVKSDNYLGYLYVEQMDELKKAIDIAYRRKYDYGIEDFSILQDTSELRFSPVHELIIVECK